MEEGPRPGTGEQAKEHALVQPRQAIPRGDMAPSQRLVENELAERFGPRPPPQCDRRAARLTSPGRAHNCPSRRYLR